MAKIKSNKETAVRVLEQLENQLLNGIESECKKDILKVIKEELHEVQQALKWIRSITPINSSDKNEATGESTLGIPDIRNKLSPITHLISMVERNEPKFIKKAIPQAKKSVNYLAQRDVYSR